MFTVFGATGNTGSIVVDRLLAAGKRVRAVARSAEKAALLAAKGAEPMLGDVTDRAVVAEALAGAEGAYLLAPPDLRSDDLLAKNRAVIDAYAAGLAAARVPHAVFLSSVGAHVEAETGPIRIARHAENTLSRVAGTTLTFVRAPFFMENILNNAAVMKSDGVLPVFGGGEEHPFPMIASRDIGETAAEALLSPPRETSFLELGGPREYSFADAARLASAILGREVSATPVPLEALVPTLTRFGFSENVAGLFRETTEAVMKGLIRYEGKGRRVTGKVDLSAVLRSGLGGGA